MKRYVQFSILWDKLTFSTQPYLENVDREYWGNKGWCGNRVRLFKIGKLTVWWREGYDKTNQNT